MSNKNKIQWHPAFCEAMRLTLKDNDSDLSYENEHMLSHKPLQVDLLVIRMESDTPIRSEIGHIFRKYNLFEYKAPGDKLNIDTYYKVLAYGCLYKSITADRVNEIKSRDISLTFVRYVRPDKMFEDLIGEGIDVRRKSPGIYYLSGSTVFKTQVIVIKELPQREYIWLKALTDDLDRYEAGQIVMDMNDMPDDSWEKPAADAIVQVAVSANEGTFDELKKEDPIMCDALRELMRPEFEAELKVATDQVTQQVTKQVKSDTLKKEREKTIGHIKYLKKRKVSMDILRSTFGDDLVDEALGKKKD